MKLWHCHDARSLRALWALEEMGLDYELEMMAFPPRFLHEGYLDVNVLGTVPYFVDGEHHLTESTGICHYLVETYDQHEFGIRPGEPGYGNYLNWLYHSDATLTFPQTLYLRYTRLEPDETKALVGEDYRKWYLARLRMLNQRVENHEFLVADRFTIADIACGYALYLGESLGISEAYKAPTLAYLERLKARPGFISAQKVQKNAAPPTA
ncbi:MAG: glutathione S-transferase family protein [Pseudomonadales bacterium]